MNKLFESILNIFKDSSVEYQRWGGFAYVITLKNGYSIEGEISETDIDVDREYEDCSFVEDFGLGPQRCDPGSGYIINGVSVYDLGDTCGYYDEDELEISKEEFFEGIGISEEEFTKEACRWLAADIERAYDNGAGD